MISIIIPTAGNNQDYTEYTINSIRQYYPNKNEVEIILQEDSTVTLGINYNNAVAKAKGDKIILMHNDMVISKGFIETMDKHIQKGRITTYTRIEPPIYNDIYPGKVILDCGSDLKDFDLEKWNNFNIEESLINGGSQLFFGCMKEDYIGIDGYTFKMFCEDDDLHLRYKIAGFEHKVSSAHVYHFVSKTSRSNKDYKQIEIESNQAFLKKWGFRNSYFNKVRKIYYNIEGDYPALSQGLEVFSTSILEKADVIITVNVDKFINDDHRYILQMSDIITYQNEIGEFELGNLKINVKSLNSYEKDLIYLKNP
jgi:cellulose synthase/poly-beta-1,6-N-acetylglucosamine synthase-like glycosyltransferase